MLIQWSFQKRVLLLLLVGGSAVLSDQASKSWAQRNLAKGFLSIENTAPAKEGPKTVLNYYPVREVVVVPNLFHLAYRENPAAAFSLTRSLPDWFRRPFLLCVSFIAILFFLAWYLRLKETNALLMLCISLIVGGALGNLIDRATLGYVIDFLDVYAGVFGYSHLHWPTFNLADSYIVVGAIGLMLLTIKNPA